MAGLLQEGVEFESFDAFQAAMEQYEDANFVQFSRIDSRSVEKAQETSLSKTYNPQIKFSQLTYACTFGPRKGPSKSTGIRNSNSRKIDCPVRIRISATPDGQRLVIKESKLDCHNHEISEEQYRSLSRQKQLDEETEMEIYNLISTHEDKRLARMLIRDKLTKETGRAMSIKDILNIEKKINRKLEYEKRVKYHDLISQKRNNALNKNLISSEAGGGSNDDSDASESEEVKDSSLAEDERTKQDEHEEKTPPAEKAARDTQTSTASRPQRTRREPRRFRDTIENGISVPHTSKDSVISSVSADEADEPSLTTPSPKKVPPTKVKEEPVSKAKKRKGPSNAEHSDAESLQERKLAIKEELLEMEKKKMTLLEDIVKKLDKIIENQEHR
ncbi:unnamed protein product [Candidula unifasciata]|uniref:ZSWIM3 N-terminal domain-containing protein n=1 Tax=Candidula unifasciata TaxID=100452 RepID=A0A8S3ZG92_9EUPU|nr:unnamed protein product [Candidula unifasciata]